MSVSPRARRYNTKTMARARELRDAGCWTLTEIADLLERELGVRPTRETLARWTDPKRAAEIAARGKRNERRRWNPRITGQMPSTAHLTADFRLIRIRALDELGLTNSAIATVMTFDFREPITRHQVERILATGRMPRAYSRREVAA